MDGFNYNMITGEVDIDTRMDMVDRFQDPAQDEYILLISTLAGGVGLNLTAVNLTLCSCSVKLTIGQQGRHL